VQERSTAAAVGYLDVAVGGRLIDRIEVSLQKKNRDELLRRAFNRLSREHREVIDSVYYHEKSVDEVAQILDLPPATVKTCMFYARKKLAELVNPLLK